jgi:hypothetical protein
MIKDGKILLLENVSVDRNLPKYKDTNTANSVNNAWISVPFEKSCTILYI